MARRERIWVASVCVGLVAATASAQLPPPPPSAMPRGLVTSGPAVSDGYVLFSPILSSDVYLLDNRGRVVHGWTNELSGLAHYLRPGGRLLRGARDPAILHFKQGGVSGILQELAWDGTLRWQYELGDADRVLHHDIEPLPNGNVLALAWERKTREEAIAAGRSPAAVPEAGLLAEWVLEIEPTRPRGGRVVWEWHVWDHLVPPGDDPAAHPRRLDPDAGAGAPAVSAAELEQLKALGYVAPRATVEDLRMDFLHANAIDYHPGLDQIAISVPFVGEVWILDHSTTTEEARGSTGGRAGRGGDLLYRWGNPATYGRGDAADQRLFAQHDVRWIPEGQAGAGNLTVFNNGLRRPEGAFSSVDEWSPPLGPDGRYALADGAPWGPAELAGEIRLPPDRFAPFISGAERLPNGNTFVCSGTDGILLETDPAGTIVWEYRNPYSGDVRLEDGSPPGPGIDERPFAVFRAHRIPPDHPGLAGRTPGPLAPQPTVHVGEGAGAP